ncbi:MAG TPA: glycerophosphodiester phosphodiesterase [Desulfocapsa sulfexigens]|nr:glycerophosphodiester phosphodiesterase [Desulfocapsa sulfexigens]
MRYLLYFTKQYSVLLVLLSFSLCPIPAVAKLVIAQGGSSGYLMEHSLPSVALAVAMDSDIIKIDTVLTADNEVIVLGSPDIAKATNVAEIFPDRIRDDGKYYALDFTLDEIRELTLRDPAGRFPKELQPNLKIPTLEETLALIVALDKSLEKNSRVAVELKQAWLHRKEGKDLTKPVLTILQKYGYTGQSDKTFLMSYDEEELKRIKKQLLPEMGMSIKLVQLIESNEGQETMVEEWGEWRSYNYDLMFFKSGLRSLSRTVAAIALPKYMLVDSEGKLLRNDFVKNAQQLGTMIFTFPVQKDERMRLPFVHSFDEELEFFYFTVGVDGIITDFCRDALDFLKNRVEKPVVLIDTEQVIPPSMEITPEDPLQLTSPLTLD